MKKQTLAESGKKKSGLILEEGLNKIDNKTLLNLQVLVLSSNDIQTKITTSDLFLPLVKSVRYALEKPSVAKSILYEFFGGEPDILDDKSLKLNKKITTENTKIQDDNKKIK